MRPCSGEHGVLQRSRAGAGEKRERVRAFVRGDAGALERAPPARGRAQQREQLEERKKDRVERGREYVPKRSVRFPRRLSCLWLVQSIAYTSTKKAQETAMRNPSTALVRKGAWTGQLYAASNAQNRRLWGGGFPSLGLPRGLQSDQMSGPPARCRILRRAPAL